MPCWECRYCKRGDYNMCEGACSISQLSPFNLIANEKRAHTCIHVHTHRYPSLRLRVQAIFSRLESSILSKCKHRLQRCVYMCIYRLQRCIYMCMESSLGAMATYMNVYTDCSDVCTCVWMYIQTAAMYIHVYGCIYRLQRCIYMCMDVYTDCSDVYTCVWNPL